MAKKPELPAESGSTTGKPLAETSTPPAVARWRVEVLGVPTREVKAADEAGAWEAFRALFHIVRTKQPVKITRLL